MLEWYRNGVDYHALMEECERLIHALVPSGELVRNGRQINLVAPWERLTVKDAFARYASQPLSQALANERFEEILTGEVEPNLGKEKPTFITEYPAELASLARLKPQDPAVAERFELYIDGMELANAFSELTDPAEQRQRFTSDEQARRDADKPARELPEPFLAELDTLPECAGIALGLDRLIMFLTGADKIDDVVALTPESL